MLRYLARAAVTLALSDCQLLSRFHAQFTTRYFPIDYALLLRYASLRCRFRCICHTLRVADIYAMLRHAAIALLLLLFATYATPPLLERFARLCHYTLITAMRFFIFMIRHDAAVYADMLRCLF